MTFRVNWDEKAFEELRKLEPNLSKRIAKKTRELSENLFSKDIKNNWNRCL